MNITTKPKRPKWLEKFNFSASWYIYLISIMVYSWSTSLAKFSYVSITICLAWVVNETLIKKEINGKN